MLNQIIDNEKIEILMQPVVSPNKDLTAGVEALVRGIDPISGERISPGKLFGEAKALDMIIPLEKLIIKKALESFKSLHEKDPTLLLFINLSDDFLTYAKHSFYITQVVEDMGLPYDNIVFDLHVLDNDKLDVAKEFVKNYREKGFLICMDDIGHNYYNIDKIFYLIPDIIKVNMMKLKNMEDTMYRQLLLNNLVQVSNTMGMIAVAKGVETADDIGIAMKYGVQFIQGYYISKPIEPEMDKIVEAIEVFQRDSAFTDQDIEVADNSRMITAKIIRILNDIKGTVEQGCLDTFKDSIEEIYKDSNCIENVWLVNDHGRLVDDSVINDLNYVVNKSPIYQIYQEGADFSTKEHFTMLQGSFMDSWVTKPYKSILTNNICIGGSVKIKVEEEDLILCVNVNYDTMKDMVLE